MGTTVGWVAVVGLLGSTGCAETIGAASRPSAVAFEHRPSVRIGDERVIGTRINPLVPLHAKPEGSTIEVRFGERGLEKVARLDPESLQLLSEQQVGRSEDPAAPPTARTRVVLHGGRFLVCWTEESPHGGRRAMARMWEPNGFPRGAAVAISPPDADVLGVPRITSVDGQHVVATFVAASGGSFELRATSLEDSESSAKDESLARR